MARKKDLLKEIHTEELTSLDPTIVSSESKSLENDLLHRVVGQDQAVHKLVQVYQTFQCGLNTPGKPLAVLLFLGPTGVGKTRLIQALAEVLLGGRDHLLKIDCAEFQNDHEIAKLLGSPPGYIGHDKTQPRITQAELDKWQKPTCKVSILLLDEIEKASEDFFQLMLGIMEGRLTLGNNDSVDLSRTIIVMTSNLAADSIQKIISGEPEMGFSFSGAFSQDNIDDKLWDVAKDALKKRFSPEFVNRITRSIVFKTLTPEALLQIIDIELINLQDRLLTGGNFILLKVNDAAKHFICKQGTDPVYGARELNRTIEHLLIEPVANLIASHQIQSSDMLVVDYLSGDSLSFYRVENVIEPPNPPDE